MCFYNLGNVIQFAGITIQGSWTFLMVVISVGAFIDLSIPVLIYIKSEKVKSILLSPLSFWLSNIVNLGFSAAYITAHVLAILELVDANHKWWLEHKDNPDPKVEKECYECNAWTSRLIISAIL